MTRRTLQGVVAGLALIGAVAWAQPDRAELRDRATVVRPQEPVTPEIVPPPDVAAAPAPDAMPARIRPNVRDEELTPPERAQVAENERRIPKDAALDEATREEVRGELRAYAKAKGKDKPVRDTVQAAVKNGCKGQCLANALRELNHARAQGLSDKEAAKLVNDSLVAQRKERANKKEQLDEAQISQRLQAKMDEKLKDRAAKLAAKNARKVEKGTGGSGEPAKPAKPAKN